MMQEQSVWQIFRPCEITLVSPYSFWEDTEPVQRDILLTGSANVENKKESSFHLHQKKMSELIWAFLQVEGCRYGPVDTAAQGTHTDTCCELLKLVTSGSKLSVSSCLLRNFMLLRPVLSQRNRIKDIHLKIGHGKKSQGELPADRTRLKWVRYLETCVFSPSQWLHFPRAMTRLKSSAQQPSRQMEISVTPHISELDCPNCKSCLPFPLWSHPQYIRTGHDME